MSLINSYALWNNKGGVGKSTISFHLSMRYAETHPDAKVLVIDLCPQANSSMMLLGGGALGDERVVELCSREIPKSVVGYVSTVITNGRGANLPNPYDFLIHVSDYNKGAPDNLYLLCGDGNMEPMAPAINEAASAKALTPNAQPWKWIIEIFKNFILNIADSQDDWMFFVDTNPSFSIYTQMAIAAVERLLTPINADDSSKTAASAMIALLHGTNPPHPIYGSWTFAALSDATATALYDIYQKNPSYFVSAAEPISTKEQFKNYYSVPLRDFNTVGVVCAHLGRLMSSMKQGYYPVYGVNVKVNMEKIQECLKAIDMIIVNAP